MTARRTAEGRRGRRPLWTCHFRRGREGAAGDLAPTAAVAAASFLAGSVPFFQRAARQFAAAGLHTVGNGTVSGAALYDVAGFSPLAAAGILEAANGAVGAARAERSSGPHGASPRTRAEPPGRAGGLHGDRRARLVPLALAGRRRRARSLSCAARHRGAHGLGAQARPGRGPLRRAVQLRAGRAHQPGARRARPVVGVAWRVASWPAAIAP